MKYFEFVCTRNEWRSPVAEFIASWYLDKKWLSNQYKAKSSWSHRLIADPNEIQSTSNSDVPFETIENLVKIWIEQNIFNLEEIDLINNYFQDKNIEKIKSFFDKANSVFKAQERCFRADSVHRLVNEKWLYWYLKANSNQTKPEKDVIAIFWMAQNNTNKIKEIYKDSDFSPLIETLSVYATRNPDWNLPNAFTKWEKFYNNVIDKLFEEIPMAIDRHFLEITGKSIK